jgi:hypothetical protein
METIIVLFSLISSICLLVGLLITVNSTVIEYSRAWQLLVVISISPFMVVQLIYLIVLLS